MCNLLQIVAATHVAHIAAEIECTTPLQKERVGGVCANTSQKVLHFFVCATFA